MSNQKRLQHIAESFAIIGEVESISPIGNGLINDSFKVTTASDAPNYIIQKINNAIFRDVDLLQHNIETVTQHIRNRKKAEGRFEERNVLQVVRTKDNRPYLLTDGEYWRMYLFIEDAVSFEKVDAESSYKAGKAFGEFQSQLTDLEGELGETIPDFHNMEFRIEEFRTALQQDKAGRADSIRDLIEEVQKREEYMCQAERLHREGRLPKRICHCDTKVNNMMFDKATGDFLCVIDLDTVMPSFVFSDIGDFLRTAANTGEEDDRNLENVNFDMEIYRAFTKGYLESASGFLTQLEKEMIPYAALLFPYMQFVRFLTDYINGDTYYKIQYPEHNLVRSRAQLRLLQSAEDKMKEMQDAIR